MFERFTERARQVVVLAQDEVRQLKHTEIGVEHLVAGLLREESGVAAAAMRELGLTVETARARYAKPGDEPPTPVSTPIPLTPGAKKVLQEALREALGLGDNYIGTEHLLLAVARGHGEVLGVEGEKIRGAVMTARPRKTGRVNKPGATATGEPQLVFDSAVVVLRGVLQRGLFGSLTAYKLPGGTAMDRSRYRVNVQLEAPLSHEEILDLAKMAAIVDFEMEFTKEHGLTFRPKRG